jgi:hypothetical protein
VGSYNWQLVLISGGAGVFSTLTSTGATTLATTGASTNTFGNTTGATSVGILVGSGGFTVTGAAGAAITIGTGVTTGNISVGAALTTGTFNIGGTGANTGTMTIAGGTGAQAINIGAATGGVKTIDIGTGLNANVITIGTTDGAASTLIKGGTVGITLTATNGNVAVTPQKSTLQTSVTATINGNVGSMLIDGSNATTEITAAGTKTFTITNSVVADDSIVLVTVTSQDAIGNVALSVVGMQIATHTIAVAVTNNGADTTSTDFNINFWVME